MKITVIGDIHGKLSWQAIVEKEKDADKIIFLGDYISTHSNVYISSELQLENLKNILKYKENNSNKVILLRGNHKILNLEI